MGRLFLSYARGDDEPFVERLYHALEAKGVQSWWDRKNMPSRELTFLQELRDEIESCDRLLAIIGPKAHSSEYVRSEWDHARLFGKGAVPVLRLGDWKDLPPAFEKVHAIDARSDARFDAVVEEVLRIVAEPAASPASFRRTPALPTHYVPRTAELEAIRDALLADVLRPEAIRNDHDSRTTAIVGMPGLGKSVLAAAASRLIDVRRTFQDGVIWLPVGRVAPERLDETKLGLVNALARAFGEAGSFDDVVRAEELLPDYLGRRRALIVLDDVWGHEIVNMFRGALGPRCRLLLTTRNQDLAGQLAHHVFRPPLLAREESLRLMARWSRRPVDALPAEAQALVQECGGLPLALAMIGALTQGDRPRWDERLARLRAAGLTAVDRRVHEYGNQSLLAALQVSVDSLDEEVEPVALKCKVRALYLSLAVFAEDEAIPQEALVAFWQAEGLDAHACQDAVDFLMARSLLLQPAAGLVSLHDVQHDFVRSMAPDLPALHRRLLDAYRRRHPQGWTMGEANEYLRSRLVHHLIEGGLQGEAHGLLSEETADRRNAWYEVRVAAGEVDGYFDDIGVALRGARRAGGADPSIDPASLEARYALIGSSVRSVAANLPPSMFVAMARAGLWSAGRAKDYALAIQAVDDRAATVAQLLVVAEPRARNQWATDLLDSVPVEDRRNVLAKLCAQAASLDREGRQLLFDEIAKLRLEPTTSLWDLPTDVGQMIESLGPYLDTDLADRVAEWLLENQEKLHPTAAACAASALLSRVPDQRRDLLGRRIVAIARSFGSTAVSMTLLRAAAAHLPPGLKGELAATLADAHDERTDRNQRAALAAVISAGVADVGRTLASLVAAMPALVQQQPEQVVEVFTSVAQALKPEDRVALLSVADLISFDGLRTEIRVRLVSHLARQQQRAEISRWIESAEESLQARLLQLLVEECPFGEGEIIDRLAACARRLTLAGDRIERLTGLAAKLPMSERGALLDEILGEIAALDLAWQPWAIRRALQPLAPLLDVDRLRRAHRLGSRLADEGFLLGGLGMMAKFLEADHKNRAMGMALALAERLAGWERARFVREALRDLPEAMLPSALALANGIAEAAYKVQALAVLAPHLDAGQRAQTLKTAIALADGTSKAWERAQSWSAIAAVSSEPERTRHATTALAAFADCPDLYDVGRAIEAVLAVVPPDQVDEFVDRQARRAMADLKPGDGVLAVLAARLPKPLALKAVQGLRRRMGGREAYRPLLHRLAELGAVEEAWEMMVDEDDSEGLTVLCPYLPATMLPEARDRASEGTHNEYQRAHLTALVCGRWAEKIDPVVARSMAEVIEIPSERLRALVAVAPFLGSTANAPGLVAELGRQCARVGDSDTRGDLLRGLAPVLAGLPRETLRPVWENMLPILAGRIRRQFMYDLYLLSPVLARLGGSKAVFGTLEAIRAVSRWWP